MNRYPKAGWLLPAALVALATVPVVAGAVRLAGLARSAAITPDNARFFASPLPVVLHIVAATSFAVLGAFQLTGRIRPAWHRVAGRILVPCGVVVGLSGLWMTLFYPRAEGDGALLYAIRLVFGAAMVLSMVLGYVAIRRRDFARHGAWMMRGYAIGMAAGTQVLTLGTWALLVGKPGELSRALLMGAAWVINLAVAEWAIARQPKSSKSPEPNGSGLMVATSPALER